jgi:hypothetical protein
VTAVVGGGVEDSVQELDRAGCAGTGCPWSWVGGSKARETQRTGCGPLGWASSPGVTAGRAGDLRNMVQPTQPSWPWAGPGGLSSDKPSKVQRALKKCEKEKEE